MSETPTPISNPTTALLYFDDAELYTANASVLDVRISTEGDTQLILDRTIFYPQGGGQPFDLGTVQTENSVFEIESVRFADGFVLHNGNFRSGNIKVGEAVDLKIDVERRVLNAKNHTAGHLIDAAMANCNFNFTPTKGYHFPDSPYVEYNGMIEADDREAAMEKLDAELARLISTGGKVEALLVDSYADLKDYCQFVPAYVPKDKPVRVVRVAGLGCPCGGTHMSEISDLVSVKVSKIKSKSGNVRIGYQVQD
ncbi:MAG TPA: hypothetical protein EYN38_02040 [Flavobacteriales bacterium]|nr:hypothetical protein [Flavobacteriales bacterium]